MKILWFTWKDKKHAFAGGAEVVTSEICKRLVADGNEVIVIAAAFGECKKKEKIDGYTVIRVGGRFSVYWQAYKYYKKHLIDWADFIIEEVNIVPFFTQFYIKKTKRILFIHQLGRKVWFYQIGFPLSFIGYLIEPFYIFMLRKNLVITVSESTKKDLIRFGFDKDCIEIITEGLNITPINNIDKVKKFTNPTILSLGEVRAMKRTAHIIKAFEKAKEHIPNLKLIIAGNIANSYATRILRKIRKSQFNSDIIVHGRVSISKKKRLLQKSHIVPMTSIKEGWGLVVTEANSQGTPCVVYNVDGLCDSVQHNKTGIVCNKNTPENLAKNIMDLLSDKKKYDALQLSALTWSREKTFKRCYEDFMKIILSN